MSGGGGGEWDTPLNFLAKVILELIINNSNKKLLT